MKTQYQTISGTYGNQQTECDVFVDTLNGWYAVEGSSNYNRTDPELLVGEVDVEELEDYDHFTSSEAETMSDFIYQVEA